MAVVSGFELARFWLIYLGHLRLRVELSRLHAWLLARLQLTHGVRRRVRPERLLREVLNVRVVLVGRQFRLAIRRWRVRVVPGSDGDGRAG